MKKQLTLLTFLLCQMVQANDGVYYTSGSLLVPVNETDIKVSKEVLTITIDEKDYAKVDVYYEFENPREAKTVLMAFEADAPYNTNAKFNRQGVHPFIHDFTVTMNGAKLIHSNGVIAKRFDNKTGQYATDLKPLDLAQWKGYGEVSEDILPYPDGTLYNSKLDSVTGIAYAYYFRAPFNKGRNIVHHTYRYQISMRVGLDYEIPYWLTPATRWANHQIDDFTLRIINKRNEGFCMESSMFASAPFKAKEGECWQLSSIPAYGNAPEDTPTLYAREFSSVEWHANNFRPQANILITCSDALKPHNNHFFNDPSCMVVADTAGNFVGQYLGTCGDQYLIEVQDYGLIPCKGHHIAVASAENGNGFLVINPKYTGVNIRQRPSAQSPVAGTIYSEKGELPEVYRCKGITHDEDPSSWKQWFRVDNGKTTGFVRSDLMLWDAINRY